MKILTILGTRPEIIRLSAIIKKLDRNFNHVLVNTGQNFDINLNRIFFTQFKLKKPKYNLKCRNGSSAIFLSELFIKIEKIIKKEMPNAILVLGDTNSALSTIIGKKYKIPIFHIEAGNRCYDLRVPEEINRKIIDHLADINITYSEIAKQNLLRENISADKVFKIGSPLDEVFNYYREKINKSKSLDEQVYKIEKKIGLHLDNLVLISDRLNKSREDIIPSFTSSIKFHLSKLGIPHAEFDVKFVKLDDFYEFGNTQISFIFSANKGIQAKNINDVASGGELSRLMLVIKYLSVKYFNVPCLVFDEIDSGTSGEIASMIASMMKEVSNEVQLISISHQPQIAARADHHLKVFKSEVENHTKSHVSILNKNERILEIAKLLSGKTTSNEALENAKVLLSQ